MYILQITLSMLRQNAKTLAQHFFLSAYRIVAHVLYTILRGVICGVKIEEEAKVYIFQELHVTLVNGRHVCDSNAPKTRLLQA